MVRGENSEIKPISPTQNIKFRVGLIGIDSISFNLLQKHRVHIFAESNNINRLTKEFL